MSRSSFAIIVLAVAGSIIALATWPTVSHQAGRAQGTTQLKPSIMARGLLDAPAGTAVIGADPGGGAVLNELLVEEGQQLKKGDIIAVLSNYANAEFGIRRGEIDLQKQELQRISMTSGYRAEQIAVQEVVVQTARDTHKLKTLEVARSSLSPEMRKLDLSISQRTIEREELRLKVMKEGLASDLEQLELTIRITKAEIENARSTRELALVRAPLNGVVVQISTRPGERISPRGIIKIVDMSQIRVYAEIDDTFIGRVTVGSSAEISFRGSPTIYMGKVTRIAGVVKRMQRPDPDIGTSPDSRVVQVEIECDDLENARRALGREVRVSFP